MLQRVFIIQVLPAHFHTTMFEFMSSSERHCRTLPSGERCARRCGRPRALAHTMMVALGLMTRTYNGWM